VPSARLGGVQLPLEPLVTPLDEEPLCRTLLHALSEQSWNESVPVSLASGSEKFADSDGVRLLIRAATDPRVGTFGNPFAAGWVIFAFPSFTTSLATLFAFPAGTPTVHGLQKAALWWRQYWTYKCSLLWREIAPSETVSDCEDEPEVVMKFVPVSPHGAAPPLHVGSTRLVEVAIALPLSVTFHTPTTSEPEGEGVVALALSVTFAENVHDPAAKLTEPELSTSHPLPLGVVAEGVTMAELRNDPGPTPGTKSWYPVVLNAVRF
jgi:hypothetical protein